MSIIDSAALQRTIRSVQRAKLWGRIGYTPHAKQLAVHRAIDAGAKRLSTRCGRRGGKSIMWASEIGTEMEFGPIGQLPKRLSLIAAPESDITDHIFGQLWRWIVDEGALDAKPIAKSVRERYIEMPWKARVEGKTTKEPTSLRGPGLVMTVADEYAFGGDVLTEHLIAPLLDCDGILGLPTTPNGLNHADQTHNEWLELAQRDPLYFATTWTSYDNTCIADVVSKVDAIRAYYERRGSLDIFKQEYLADPAAMRGAVYPQFDKARHVAEATPLAGVPFAIGMDWGFDHPFVALFAQVLGNEQLVIYDELYERGLTDEAKAEHVHARLKALGAERQTGYGDPSSPQAIKTFRDSGIRMWEPGDSGERTRLNNVLDGIAQVRTLLGRQDKPGLIIHPRCEQLIRTLPLYKFSDKASSDKPVKEDDDPPDALRYLVVGSNVCVDLSRLCDPSRAIVV